jgi:hypothetical protein
VPQGPQAVLLRPLQRPARAYSPQHIDHIFCKPGKPHGKSRLRSLALAECEV